jgi:hypothetical protein
MLITDATEMKSTKTSERSTKSLGKALRTANLLPFLVQAANVRISVRAPSESPKAGRFQNGTRVSGHRNPAGTLGFTKNIQKL